MDFLGRCLVQLQGADFSLYTGFSLIWFVVAASFIAFAVPLLWRSLSAAWRYALGGRWQPVAATITESAVASDRKNVYPHVRYSYCVDGRTYFGDQVQFDDPKTPLAFNVNGFVDAHPVGASVTAYYNPREPHRAVLKRQLNWPARGFELLLCGFVFRLGVQFMVSLGWPLFRDFCDAAFP